MHEDLQHYTGGSDQNNPQEKEMQKGKMAVWGGLTKLRKEDVKGKEEKERYTHLNAEFQTIARRAKKAFLVNNANREKQQNEKD